jgi:hypothetical protein
MYFKLFIRCIKEQAIILLSHASAPSLAASKELFTKRVQKMYSLYSQMLPSGKRIAITHSFVSFSNYVTGLCLHFSIYSLVSRPTWSDLCQPGQVPSKPPPYKKTRLSTWHRHLIMFLHVSCMSCAALRWYAHLTAVVCHRIAVGW